MKFPFFASFLVFCLWLGYEIRKHRNIEEKANESFWDREAEANNTRRKSLDNLNYIHIPFDTLPMDILADDPVIAEYHETLHGISDSPIVNLTGISNTELKLEYGAPNIEILSLYDQRYTILARTLQAWANALYEKGFELQAQTILEFAAQTRTDISATYNLLSSIYQKNGEADKIQPLISVAEGLNSALKEHIITLLKEKI